MPKENGYFLGFTVHMLWEKRGSPFSTPESAENQISKCY